MSPCTQLNQIRCYLKSIPGLENDLDFSLAVQVGCAQKAGAPLSLKQLMLLNIASSATVRRYIGRLIQRGVIIKNVAPSDHRTVHFSLSKSTIDSLDACLDKIHHTLCETPGACCND
jgi:hypothetical protein